jgi:hypothetical protein
LFLAIVMQKPPHPRDASRREFVREGFRYALLTGLATASAVLFQRSGGKLSGQTCSNQGICGGCGGFTNCGLPQALSAKEFQRQARNRKEAA